MVRPVSTASNEATRWLRQLKMLVAVLIVSNVGLGVFSFYLLRRIEEQYSSLIGRSVPVLTDLQTLTATSVDAMRVTNPALFSRPAAVPRELATQGEAALARDAAARNRVLQQEWLVDGDDERATLERAGAEFNRLSKTTLALLGEGKLGEAERQRETVLRPVFERYVAATTTAAERVKAESERVTGELRNRVGGMATWMLGLASWPVIVLAALLVLTGIFVVVLMFLFRGQQLEDGP